MMSDHTWLDGLQCFFSHSRKPTIASSQWSFSYCWRFKSLSTSLANCSSSLSLKHFFGDLLGSIRPYTMEKIYLPFILPTNLPDEVCPELKRLQDVFWRLSRMPWTEFHKFIDVQALCRHQECTCHGAVPSLTVAAGSWCLWWQQPWWFINFWIILDLGSDTYVTLEI